MVTVNGDGTTTVDFNITPEYRSGNLNPLEGGSIYLTARVAPTVSSGHSLPNTVCGTASNTNGIVTACDIHTPEVQNAEVTLTKAVSNKRPFLAGEVIDYTLIVSNKARLDAQGVIIKDTMDANLDYVAGTTQILGNPNYTLGEPVVTTDGTGKHTLTWSLYKQ